MIQISKEQRKYLEENGYRFGHEIHSSHSRYKKYYLVELPKAIALLSQYESKKILYSYGG